MKTPIEIAGLHDKAVFINDHGVYQGVVSALTMFDPQLEEVEPDNDHFYAIVKISKDNK